MGPLGFAALRTTDGALEANFGLQDQQEVPYPSDTYPTPMQESTDIYLTGLALGEQRDRLLWRGPPKDHAVR